MKNKVWIFSAIFAAIGFFLAIYLILGLDTFLWDEAHHAYFGNLIYHDLKSLNISGFFHDTGRQAWFQPFHSYIDALSMLMIGRSYFAARFSSTVMFLLTFLSIYKISMLINKERGGYISAVACFLLAFSPKMLVMASLNMQEMMGACMIMFFLFYFLSQKDTLTKYLTTGLLIGSIFLTKYQFGFLIGGTVFLFELFRIFDAEKRVEGLKVFIINNILVFIGFLPLPLIWFITPDSQRKIGLFFLRIQDAQGWNRGFNLGQRAFFYLQSILTEYSLSLLVGIFIVLSIFYCLKYYRDVKIRALIILAFTFYIFHTMTPAVFERLIAPAMPAVFILAGVAAVDIYYSIAKNIRYLVLAVVAIILIGDIAYLPIYAKQVTNYSFASIAYRQNVQDISPKILFGMIRVPMSFVPFNPDLAKRQRFSAPAKSKLRDVLDFFLSDAEKGKPVATLIDLYEISPYEIYWHFDGWGATVMTSNDYISQGKYFWFSEYFFALDISDSSPYKSEIVEDPQHWNSASAPFIQRGWLKLIKTKEFSDLGLTAKIYKMKLPF